jgi:small subunit ribosomal protein S17
MAEEVKQSAERTLRRTVTGVVTSDKMNKTRRVEVPRLVKHPQYGKYIRRRTICYVHDETNESRVGDTVEIMETRPLSKTKRWRLLKIVAKGAGTPVVDTSVESGTPAQTPAAPAPAGS